MLTGAEVGRFSTFYICFAGKACRSILGRRRILVHSKRSGGGLTMDGSSSSTHDIAKT